MTSVLAAGTVALDVIDALWTQLVARVRETDGLATAAVEKGWPARMEDTHLFVITRLTEWDQEWTVSGLAGKDEYVTIPIVGYVRRHGTSYADAVEPALGLLADTICQAVADDYTLGGTVMLATPVRAELEESPRPEDGAREGAVTVWVRCHAYLVG